MSMAEREPRLRPARGPRAADAAAGGAGAAIVTAGIDVGASSVKVAVLRVPEPAGTACTPAARADDGVHVLALQAERIRRRDLRQVTRQGYASALAAAGVRPDEVVYVASTGEGELVDFRRGHFYGMTTHARGATFLMPGVLAVLDVGALHARAMRIDPTSRVLGYRMTSQCASGSGQFLENVARYLGVALEDVGVLSCGAAKPETVSSICAVLAETDVINMVSRGVSTPDILKGIHLSMGERFVRLLRAAGADGPVALTGGLSRDLGLVQAMEQIIAEEKLPFQIRTHPDSIHAGAIGAALWGAFRHRKLAEQAAETA
jgi:benzoyl-CoA reductase subunit D